MNSKMADKIAEDKDAILQHIISDGSHSAGRSEAIKFLTGMRLTLGQAIKANCYLCNGIDGRSDCQTYTCPMYPHMTYNPDKGALTARQGPLRKKKDESYEEFMQRQKSREEGV